MFHRLLSYVLTACTILLLVGSQVPAQEPNLAEVGREEKAIRYELTKLSQRHAGIDSLKLGLLAEKADLAATDQSLVQRSQQLKASKAQLVQQEKSLSERDAALAKESAAIDQDRPHLRTQAEVDRFNARVVQYNQRLHALKKFEKEYHDAISRLAQGYVDHRAGVQAYERRVTAFNDQIEPYNLALNRYRDEVRDVNRRIDAYNLQVGRLPPSTGNGSGGPRIIFDDSRPKTH
jgi:chromosome segregation ATPase